MGLTSVKTLAKRILTLQFATRNKIFSVPEGHGTRSKLCLTGLLHQSYSSSAPLLGFDEFFEVKKPNEVVSTGRSWTCVDLRRKVCICLPCRGARKLRSIATTVNQSLPLSFVDFRLH